MIESFHAAGSLGYSRGEDGWSEWTIFPTPEMLHDSESVVLSEVSSVSQSSSNQQTCVERIRGECLRCLYLLIRLSEQPLQASPVTLFEDAGNRPGLPTLMRIDPSYHVRRFAMFSMVHLLKSYRMKFARPRNMRSREAPQELSGMEDMVLSALGGLLTSDDKQDWSTAEHILIDVISSITWKRVEPIHHSFLGTLIERIEGTSGLPRRIFLEGFSCIIDKGNLPDDIVDMSVKILTTWTDADPANILAANPLVSKLSDRLPIHVVHLLVGEGLGHCLHLSELKSIERSVSDQMSACLENIGLLAELDLDFQQLIASLVERAPGICRDALVLGLGKLSRHSHDTVRFVLGLDLNEFFANVSPSVIRGMGDILFSTITFGECVHANMFKEWIKNEKVRGSVLRAMMTGLSRIHSSNQNYSSDPLLNCIVSDCETLLIDIWCPQDLAVDEKVFADSVRCVGLLNRVRIPMDSFRESSSSIILDALHSGKTQRILAALASMNTGSQYLDLENRSSLVRELCCDYLDRLEENSRWDYESAEFVGGTLHVIHDCVANLGQAFSRDILNRVRSLLKHGKIHRMKAYNSSITSILERLDRLCCFYS